MEKPEHIVRLTMVYHRPDKNTRHAVKGKLGAAYRGFDGQHTIPRCRFVPGGRGLLEGNRAWVEIEATAGCTVMEYGGPWNENIAEKKRQWQNL